MQYQAMDCNQVALTEAYNAASQIVTAKHCPKPDVVNIVHCLCSKSRLVCLLLRPSDVLAGAEHGLLLLQLDLVADMPMNSSNKYFGSQWRR